MSIDELTDCPYPFGLYLKELTNDIVVLFGENHQVLGCNKRFGDLSKLGRDEIMEKGIDDLVVTEEPVLTDLPEVHSHKKIEFQLSDFVSTKINYFYTGYVFNTGSNYCLIAEERQEGEKEVLEKISLLNNALSNKTRELTKKNRKLEEANRRIEKLSKTDVLTGLANRRHFKDYFEKTLSQAQRHSHPLSLVMLDLDNFKDINDTYGHDAGDEVLSALGDLLERETREEDLAARIGGEEFAVLLTQADPEQARSYAERLRERINRLEVESVSGEISGSLGISTMKQDDDPESLMKRADRALYKAKDNGRNRVCKT
ncbi:GGDEF domain-containing protein [Candidatus Bipolaricaulota bacterium]|nr:GGDEF domain-containing protein [Candidatus Bipolaricaulota bacterium]